jgi:hypothetical protein
MPTGTFCAGRWLSPLPNSVALLVQIGRKTPLMPDRMPRDEAGHHLRLRRVDNANHVDAGAQARTSHDVVDAGADRADRLKVRIVREGIVGRMPGDGEANIRIGSASAMIDDLDAIRDAGELRAKIAAQVEAFADKRATHHAALDDDIWPGTAARSSRV